MQRIFNIEKWTVIPQGKAMKFEGDRYRKVVLEVNCPGVAVLQLVQEKGSPQFLAKVSGRDTIEFYVDRAFSIGSTGSDCFVYTVDGDSFTWEDVDPASFATVRERAPRNYELELIAAKMAENMNRRLEVQARELESAMERRAAAREARQSSAASVAAGVPGAGAAAASDDPAESVSPPAGKRGPGRPPGKAASRSDDAE